MTEGGFVGEEMWLSLSSVKERLVAVGHGVLVKHWAEPRF